MSFMGLPRFIPAGNRSNLPPVETVEDLLKLTHGEIARLHMNWRLGFVPELVFITERVPVSKEIDLDSLSEVYRAYLEPYFGPLHICNLHRHWPHTDRMNVQLSWERPPEAHIVRLLFGRK